MAFRMPASGLLFGALLLMGAALATETARDDDGLSQAVTMTSVLGREPDIRRGGELYATTCKACHQASGWGVTDGSVPHIAGQHYSYVGAQLIEFRWQYRGNERMQHFLASDTYADPQTIADVAGYVSALVPSPTPGGKPADTDKRGRAVFVQMCQHCHSNDGEGNATLGVPRIAGQYSGYLVRRIKTIMQREEHYSNALLPMLLDDLPDADIQAVAGYVANLGLPASSRQQSAE